MPLMKRLFWTTSRPISRPAGPLTPTTRPSTSPCSWIRPLSSHWAGEEVLWAVRLPHFDQQLAADPGRHILGSISGRAGSRIKSRTCQETILSYHPQHFLGSRSADDTVNLCWQ